METDFTGAILEQKTWQISHLPGLDADSLELLTYYRNCLSDSEKTRQDWMQKIEAVRVNKALLHKTEWEARVRDQEIEHLNRQIGDLENALSTERNELVRLAREQEALRQQNKSDVDKIKQLMGIIQPIQQDIHYNIDSTPATIQKYPAKGIKSKLSSTPRSTYILRTINMPNEEANSLAEQIDHMQKAQDELIQQYITQISHLKEEKRMQEGRVGALIESSSQKTQELVDQIKNTDKSTAVTTKDYLRLKYEASVQEKKLVEDYNVLRNEADDLLIQLRDLFAKNKQNTKTVTKKAVSKAQDYAQQFIKQAKSSEDNLTLIKEQYATLKQVYSSKISQLESRYSQILHKYSDLKDKINLEKQGFTSDIHHLEFQKERIERPSPSRGSIQDRIPPAKKCDRCETHPSMKDVVKRDFVF